MLVDSNSTLNSTNATLSNITINVVIPIINSTITTGHIANFKQFFKISAFFIAFILFYAITVPLIMWLANKDSKVIGGLVQSLRRKAYSNNTIKILSVLWILYVMILPFVLLILWGMLLAWDPMFSNQFGIGIALIGIFVLFIFLGFADWYGHKWQLTKLSIGLFITATVAGFFYCFAVIFLPKYFTYNGTTAIFMSLNFIFSTMLIYLKTTGAQSERFLKTEILVNTIIENGGFQQNSANNKLTLIMDQAKTKNKRFLLFTKIGIIVLYLCTFIAYFIVIISQNPKEYKLVGVAHTVILIFSDLMIYWLDNHNDVFMIKDWFKCGFMFATRLVCCFLLDYWLSLQSIALLLSIVVCGSNFFEKFFVLEENTKENKFQQLILSQPLFKKYVEKNITEVIIPTVDVAPKSTILSKIEYYVAEFILLIYIAVHLACCIITAKVQFYLKAKEFKYINTFPQWVVPLFALMLGVLCVLFYGWFRYYKQKCNFVPNMILFASLLIIEGISIAMAFVFHILLTVDAKLIWTSFVILPAVVGSFLLFYGNWLSNDYFFYEQKKTTTPSSSNQVLPSVTAGDPTLQELNKDDIALQVNKEQANKEEPNQEVNVEGFWANIAKIVKCGYLPIGSKTSRDKLTFGVVVLNIALLILYTILTAAIFKPWWIGFTIGLWVMILQLTIIIFIKYYQMYYKMSFAVQFCLILAVSIFIAWVVVISIYVFLNFKAGERTLSLVIFGIVSGGYLFIVILILAFLKLITLTDKTQLPLGLQLLFTFAFLIVGAVGAAIIALTDGDVWGHVLCGTCVYMIIMLYLQKWRKWITLGYGVVLLGYAIFGIIYYHNFASIVLQCLSMILIVIFLFFGLSFIRVYLENKEARSTSIFMYSSTLFPVMRYDYAQQKMINSNTELIYFFAAGLTFFIWSFLAGILLKLQDRYIGISFSAICIAMMYLYVSDRIKKAIFLVAEEYAQANLQFFTASINYSLVVKQKWRNSSTLGEQQIASTEDQEKELSQEEVSQEINHHTQWEDLYQVQSGELGDTLSRILFFSTTTKDSSVLSSKQELVNLQQQSMKDSDTQEKKLDVVLKTQEIMHRELLFNVQFYAFLTGFMTLKLKNLNDKIKQAMELWALGEITRENTDDEFIKEKERQRLEEEAKKAEEARQRAEAFRLAEEARRQEEAKRLAEASEEDKRKIAEAKAAEEELIRQQQKNNNLGPPGQPIPQENIVKQKVANQDENYLLQEGDRFRQQIGNQQFIDKTFTKDKALAGLNNNRIAGWDRIKDLTDIQGRPYKDQNIKVFVNGAAANDIRQGELGDCYLLSAFSVVAHSRSDLIQRIFHPQSLDYKDNGLYTVMFFKNRKPIVIHIDDYFPTDKHKRYNFVKCSGSNQNDIKEVWPIILEKAYAKLYGSFQFIAGGQIDEALSDITNGAPMSLPFDEADVKKMFDSGELWQRLTFWINNGYLMGCSSPPGTDTHTSDLGIVQGHAYSVLDAIEVEGNKLLQIRNPWGEGTEWKGAWGDKSSDWTERRKQIVYERMRQRGTEQIAIGAEDGTFWISYVDWYRNFASLSLCKYFNQDFTELNYNSSWSIKNNTAGGCINHDSFPDNPQLALTVQGNGPVEVFILLTTGFQAGDNGATISIGFRIVENGGKRVTGRFYDKEIAKNYRGFMTATRVSLDTKLNPTTQFPYILIPSTFAPKDESNFTITLWYNHTQGQVSLAEMPK